MKTTALATFQTTDTHLESQSAGIQIFPHKAASAAGVASEDEAESVKGMTNIFLGFFVLFFFFTFQANERIRLALVGSI